MPDEKPPSPTLIAVRRDHAFDAIVETAMLAESYARSILEAAYRGDQTTVEVHLKQLRLCVLSMIGTFKEYLGPSSGD